MPWAARVLAALLYLVAFSANAGLFPAYPIGVGPGVWEVDRYAPAGFTNAGTLFGRPSVLALTLSAGDSQANRPPAFSSAFYNTQGRGIQQNLLAYSVLYGSLYVPTAWATTNPGDAVLNRRSELWGVLSPPTGADTCPGSACNLFPIIGFTNASAASPLTAGGAPRLRVFETNIGFVDLAAPVSYDAWTDVCIAFTGSELRFYANGVQVYLQSSLVQADPSFGPPTKWTRATMQAYNFAAGYTANWSNIGGGTLAAAAVAGGSGQSAPLNTAFAAPLQVLATDGGGTPLPCVPVTFAAPGAGASAALSGTTVVTNLQGIAQVSATANGTAGACVVTATAPGLPAAQFNLVNGSQPATLAKAFNPSSIAAGGTATLTLTLGNPNPGPLTLAAQFVDLLPAGMVATTPNAGTCAGVNVLPDSIVMASGAMIPPGGCTIVSTVTAPSAGTLVNQTGSLATDGGFTLPATATLTVTSVAGPSLAKSFAPSTINATGDATLTLALGNPGAAPITLTAAFTDAMPATVQIGTAHSGTCAGVTVTPSTITMAAGTAIPPGGCTIVVGVTSPVPGSYTNTTSVLQTSAGTAAPASAVLTVKASVPLLFKSFQPTAIVAGGTSTLQLRIVNPNAGPAGILTLTQPFIDPMPAGVTIASGNSGTCAGVATTTTAITWPSGSSVPNGDCTIVVTVTASSPGAFVNTTSSLVTNAGTTAADSATLDVSAGVALVASGGGGQSAPVNTTFGSVLQATVTQGGAPVAGVVVTFTFPGSGASGTFAGGGTTATVTTNASGVASSPPITANGIAGSYTAAASAAGAAAPVSYALTNVGAALPAAAIPTLGPGALIALIALVGFAAIRTRRRRG